MKEEIKSEKTNAYFESSGGWNPNYSYTISLSVKMTGFQTVRTSMTFFANSPPYNGTCEVTPTTGIAGYHDFVFSMLGWRDEGERPNRNYYQDKSPILLFDILQYGEYIMPFVYTGGEKTTPPRKLIACGTPDETCQIVISIIDMFRSITNCTLNVTVKHSETLETDDDGTLALETVNGAVTNMTKILNRTLAKNNPAESTIDLAAFSTIVQKMDSEVPAKPEFNDSVDDILDPTSTESESKTEMNSVSNSFVDGTNSAVMDAISRGEVKKPDEIQIFAESLTTVTSSPKMLTGASLDNASSSLSNLGDILVDMQSNGTLKVKRDAIIAKQAIENSLDNLISGAAVNVSSLEPDIHQLDGRNKTYSPEEKKYLTELLAKRRQYKAQDKIDKAENVSQSCRKTWSSVQSVSQSFVESGGSMKISKKAYNITMDRSSRRDLLGLGNSSQPSGNETGSDFSLDDIDLEDGEDDEEIYPQVTKSENIFTHGKNSKLISSNVVLASVTKKGGKKLQMTAPKVTHDKPGDIETRLVKPRPFLPEDASQIFYHSFDVKIPGSEVCMKIKPENKAVFYRLYIKIGAYPTDVNYDHRETVSIERLQNEEICISSDKFGGTGMGFIGLRPFYDENYQQSLHRRKRDSGNSTDSESTNSTIGDVKDTNTTDTNTTDDSNYDPILTPYFFGVSEVACYSWDDVEMDWLASKCKMSRTSEGKVLCTCSSGREVISALSFNFAPNTIDFNSVFSKFDISAQGAVLGTLMGIFIVSLFVMVWASYMDRKGILQWGVFPLSDNYACDNYFYLISVYTGLRRSAGTLSNVKISLDGEYDESGVRELSDGIRKGFPTGSVVHMVMACPAYLGPLQCLRVWHDNTGRARHGSWYLDRIDIVDLQTGHNSHFICEEWMTAENNTIDKVLEACDTEGLTTFKTVFFTNAKQRITDEHIWFSCFNRPERSTFSRLERVGCCMAFLYLSMITSAMFQETDNPDREQPPPDFEMGPIRLSLQQIWYSFLSAVISAIPMTVLMLIFRKALTEPVEGKSSCCRRKKSTTYTNDTEDLKESSKTNSVSRASSPAPSLELSTIEPSSRKSSLARPALSREPSTEGSVFPDENLTLTTDPKHVVVDQKNSDNTNRSCCMKAVHKLPWMVKLDNQLKGMEKVLLVKPDAIGQKGAWPYWTRHLGWAIIFFASIVCSFFIMLYSMQWGKDVSEEFLSTFFLSFLQSMIVVDPFKVVLLSMVIAMCFRKFDAKGGDILCLEHVSDVNKNYGLQTSKPREYVSFQSPMSDEELHLATMRRKVHVLIKHFFRDLINNVVLFILVCSLCFNNRSPSDYRMHSNIQGSLIESAFGGLQYVNGTAEYFKWVSDVVIPFLLPATDYTGRSVISQDKQYTADWDLYRLGAPRLRQSRMVKSTCDSDILDSLRKCVGEYSITREETTEYCIGWKDPPCPKMENLRSTAGSWYFQSAFDIWGIPVSGDYDTYGGGGYIANLDINNLVAKHVVNELKSEQWIDRQTRAVFLEFTLYAPNINRFVFNSILVEFPETGGIFPYSNIYPFVVDNPKGFLGVYMLLCELLAILLILTSLIYVSYVLWVKGKKAMKDFWFMIDFLTVTIGLACIALGFIRWSFIRQAIEKMHKDNTKYVNFQQVVIWDTAYTSCLAFMVAIASFRMLKMSAYSKPTARVYAVLKLAAKSMPTFIFLLTITLVSFAFLSWMTFGKTSYLYRSFFNSLETLFTAIVGNSRFKRTNVPLSEEFFTVTFIFLFGWIVVIFMQNVLLADYLALFTVSAQRDSPEVNTVESNVGAVLWATLLQKLGYDHNPIDVLEQTMEPEKDKEKVYDPEAGLALNLDDINADIPEMTRNFLKHLFDEELLNSKKNFSYEKKHVDF